MVHCCAGTSVSVHTTTGVLSAFDAFLTKSEERLLPSGTMRYVFPFSMAASVPVAVVIIRMAMMILNPFLILFKRFSTDLVF